MEDETSFEAFGIEFGMRMVRTIAAPKTGNERIGEQVVECSARQAAFIFKLLGVAHRVDEAIFGRVVGMLAGSNSAFITELTGQPIPVTDDAVPNAYQICSRAFDAMQR